LFFTLGTVACIGMSLLTTFWVASLPFANARMVFLVPTLFLSAFLLFRVLSSGLTVAVFDPAVGVSGGFLLFYSAGVLLHPGNYARFYSSPQEATHSAVFYCVAVLMFFLGYTTFCRIPPLSSQNRRSQGRLHPARLWMWLILAAVALLAAIQLICSMRGISLSLFVLRSAYTGEATAEFLSASGLDRYTHYLTRMLPVSVSILSAVYLSLQNTRRCRRVTALALLITSSFFLLATGSRFRFAYASGGALLVWFAFSRQFAPEKSRAIRIRLVLGVLIIVGIAIQMIIIRNIGGVLKYARSRERKVAQITDFVDGGLDQLPRLQMVMDAVPQKRSYLLGITYLSPLFTLVPRALWPAKPSDVSIYMVGKTELINPNTTFGILGELYLNFGLYGIFLGMWAFGALARAWRSLFLRRQGDYILTCVYAACVPVWFFVVRGGFHSMVASMLYPLLFVLVALRCSLSMYPARAVCADSSEFRT